MSQFQKGQPRPANAGRKPGSKNKKKIAKVADFLAQKDINPAEQILAILDAKHECNAEVCEKNCKFKGKYLLADQKDRADIWLDLLSYCQGKPKEMEMDFDDESFEDFDEVSNEQLLTLIKTPGAV